MNSEKIKITSNKNFGLVFFVFFLIISFYPLLNNENIRLWSLLISLIFLILGLSNSKILTPFNKLWINFGKHIGEKKSSAQITDHYKPNDLIGKKILAVINLEPRQIGNFISEVLVLGVPDMKEEGVFLVVPDNETKIGSRLY